MPDLLTRDQLDDLHAAHPDAPDWLAALLLTARTGLDDADTLDRITALAARAQGSGLPLDAWVNVAALAAELAPARTLPAPITRACSTATALRSGVFDSFPAGSLLVGSPEAVGEPVPESLFDGILEP